MNVEEWSNLSLDGKMCGMVGCGAEPKNECPICNHFYCTDDIKRHVHVGKESVFLICSLHYKETPPDFFFKRHVVPRITEDPKQCPFCS